MIKVIETKPVLTNTGEYALEIRVGQEGIETDLKGLVEKSRFFNKLQIIGLCDDLNKFVNKVIKEDEDKKVDIYIQTDIEKPKGFTKTSQVTFKVRMRPKQEVDEKTIKWFNDVGAQYHFIIRDLDEVDDLVFTLSDKEIKKSNVHLVPATHKILENLTKACLVEGLNVAPDFQEWLWSH